MGKKQRELMLKDSGIIIYDKDTNEWYCGLNTFSASLREAKVYHNPNYVNAIFDRYKDRDLGTKRIFMNVTDM